MNAFPLPVLKAAMPVACGRSILCLNGLTPVGCGCSIPAPGTGWKPVACGCKNVENGRC